MKILDTIRLTSNQKKVLATIHNFKDEPTLAVDHLVGDTNLVGARKMLMDLGAITFTETSVHLTDSGLKLARDQGIVDDAGNLTPEGTALVASYNGQQSPRNDIQTMEPSFPPEESAPSMEGFSPLFKELLIG